MNIQQSNSQHSLYITPTGILPHHSNKYAMLFANLPVFREPPSSFDLQRYNIIHHTNSFHYCLTLLVF